MSRVSRRDMDEFYERINRGDIVGAICNAPFGHVSTWDPVSREYSFRIDGGPLDGNGGIAPTLTEAVRIAAGLTPQPIVGAADV
jgi:hypothetical protein